MLGDLRPQALQASESFVEELGWEFRGWTGGAVGRQRCGRWGVLPQDPALGRAGKQEAFSAPRPATRPGPFPSGQWLNLSFNCEETGLPSQHGEGPWPVPWEGRGLQSRGTSPAFPACLAAPVAVNSSLRSESSHGVAWAT